MNVILTLFSLFFFEVWSKQAITFINNDFKKKVIYVTKYGESDVQKCMEERKWMVANELSLFVVIFSVVSPSKHLM
jgi:hypothetical protein